MHTLASPLVLTYKLGKHTAATKADVLQSKKLKKKMITLFFKYGNNYSHNK